jgi:hypothetical protein
MSVLLPIIVVLLLTLPLFLWYIGGVRSMVLWMILVVVVLGTSTLLPTGSPPVGEICRTRHVAKDAVPFPPAWHRSA